MFRIKKDKIKGFKIDLDSLSKAYHDERFKALELIGGRQMIGVLRSKLREYMEINRFEYIKWFWRYIDDETPVLLFYEVDLENERHATRMIEVFSDKTARPVIEAGFDFVTEVPVPDVKEINQESEFYAEIISSDEFENIYNIKKYSGSYN